MTWFHSDVSVSQVNKAFWDDVGPISTRRLSCWLDIGPTYTREVVFAGSQLHGVSLVYARMNTEVYGIGSIAHVLNIFQFEFSHISFTIIMS